MLQPLQEHILQAGLVDLDGSYLVQLAIFVVFALILNLLVVKPLGKLQELRYARMEGARIEAQKMDLRAADASASYRSRIGDARAEAVGLREAARDQATTEANSRVSAVRDEATRHLEAGREVLDQSAERGRADLEQEVEKLAAYIADRLLDAEGKGV
jgi:F-type H+-transporting ATPase subunit b